MVSKEMLERTARLIRRIRTFGGDDVPAEYALVENVTEAEKVIIAQERYLPRLVSLPENQKERILSVFEGSWQRVTPSKCKAPG